MGLARSARVRSDHRAAFGHERAFERLQLTLIRLQANLAISLIFGIAVSTLLTLVVIPLLRSAWLSRRGTASAAAPSKG